MEKRSRFGVRFSAWVAASAVSAAVLLLAIQPAAALFGDKFEDELEKEKGCVKLLREVERGGYRVVDTKTLKQWVDSGKDMVILDAMPKEASYDKAHVPGAEQFLFPSPEMEEWDAAETSGTPEDFMKLLGPDKSKPVVVYCGFVKCTRSHNGAMWAVNLGYENVYRYPGGIFAWKGADYPVAGSD
jgi:rhodanese-related sulfurtransferase